MRSYDDMVSALRPLGLYRLDGSSLVCCELKAYAKGIDKVTQELAMLEQEAFIQTATGVGLDKRELMFSDKTKPGLNIALRRELLMNLCSIRAADFNAGGIERMLAAIGIYAQITEDVPNETLLLEVTDYTNEFISFELIKNQVDKMMPAHLAVNIDMGVLEWNLFDQLNLDCNRLDEIDFTFDEFEISGHRFQ